MGKNLSFCWTFFTKYLLSNNQYVVLLFEYFSLFLYLSNIFHNFFLVDNISQNIRASKMFRGPRLSNMLLSNIFPSKKVLSKITRGSHFCHVNVQSIFTSQRNWLFGWFFYCSVWIIILACSFHKTWPTQKVSVNLSLKVRIFCRAIWNEQTNERRRRKNGGALLENKKDRCKVRKS